MNLLLIADYGSRYLNRMKKIGFTAALFMLLGTVYAQKLDYECYPIGNDYPGNSVWVPHNVADVFVTPEGTTYTNVPWEENGANVTQINPNGTITRHINVGNHGGGMAVTANATHIYFAGDNHRRGNEGIDRRTRSNPDYSTNLHVDCGGRVFGLAVLGDKVYASVKELDVIKVYDLDLNPLESENLAVNDPEDLFFDSQGMLWVLQPATNTVLKYNPRSNQKQDEIALEPFVVPTDIAIDKNDRLYVTDISTHEQIRIYKDITTTPVFEGTFGTQGGIHSGVPGVYRPLKFDMPIGVGVDDNGNIIVANREGKGNGSTIIQKYNSGGEMLWDLMCVAWIDMHSPDPDNENIIYTSREKMHVDYSRQEWSLESITLNRHRYPDDYRVSGNKYTGITWIRKLYGKKFMFLKNMNGNIINIYKFDGEIAVPTGHIETDNLWHDADGDGQMDASEKIPQTTGSTRGWYVDINGTIWQASRGKGIYRYPLEGVDEHGALKYSLDSRVKYNMPAPFTELRRIRFYPERNNLMVINGFTTGAYRNISHHWKIAGKVFRGYENWSGQFGEASWEIIPPFYDRESGGHGDGNVNTFEVVDEYVFMAHSDGSSQLGIGRGTVKVFKLDGTYVGYMEPTLEMGRVGLLDIPEAMNAYRLSWGPYVVGIEDDGKAKIVMYQWCPTGDCKPSSMEIQLGHPPNDTLLYTYNGIRLEPEVTADTCTIDRVEYYAGGHLLGAVQTPPYAFTLPDTSLGKTQLQAKVIERTGAYKLSQKRYLTVSDGTPVTTLTEPEPGREYNRYDTLLLSAGAFDYDGRVDSVEFYVNDSRVGSDTTAPFQYQWKLPDAGDYHAYAMAWDDSGKSGRSPSAGVLAHGYRPASGPQAVKPGLIYAYYEGTWDVLPDFSSLAAMHKDTVSTISIDAHGREDGFAFRFTGYIRVSEKGRYTFYTASNDGSRLSIGDRMLVDNDGVHYTREASGEILLEAGLHPLEVSMFDRSGLDNLSVQYQGPGITRQEIPAEVLFRPVGTPPAVSLTHPANQAMVNAGDTLRLRASIEDPDEDVHRIAYYTGTTFLGQFADTGHVLLVDTLPAGSHTLRARAYDLGGSVSESQAITITVNARPEIRITSPAPLTQYTGLDTIRVKAEVTDDNARQVRFYVNEVLTRTLEGEPWEVELTGMDRGSKYIRATVRDANMLQASDKIRVRVVNTPPSISIIRPDSGAVFAPGEEIELQAGVTDPDDNVYKVAFYQEDRQIGADANIYYATRVKGLEEGTHTIIAKAFDKEGAVSSSGPITITVGGGTGITRQVEAEGLSLYPNPLERGSLVLTIPAWLSKPATLTLEISNALGKIILQEEVEPGTRVRSIPRDQFPVTGVYVISIRGRNGYVHEKLLVK